MSEYSANELHDRISEELRMVSIAHDLQHKWSAGQEIRQVGMLATFGSVRSFAAALERAGADASFSFGSGWQFRAAPPETQEPGK